MNQLILKYSYIHVNYLLLLIYYLLYIRDEKKMVIIKETEHINPIYHNIVGVQIKNDKPINSSEEMLYYIKRASADLHTYTH